MESPWLDFIINNTVLPYKALGRIERLRSKGKNLPKYLKMKDVRKV